MFGHKEAIVGALLWQIYGFLREDRDFIVILGQFYAITNVNGM